MTTGEGGMIVTDDPELAGKARYHRNLCFPLDGPRNYRHNDIGFNYRMNNIQAAIGLAQLERIDEYIEKRRAHAQLYTSFLQDCRHLQLPIEKSWAKNCYWMYGVVLRPSTSISRNQLMAHLSDSGIETRPFFEPMHKQPVFHKYLDHNEGEFPVSSTLGTNGLYLPSGSNLTSEDIEFVCDRLNQWLR